MPSAQRGKQVLGLRAHIASALLASALLATRRSAQRSRGTVAGLRAYFCICTRLLSIGLLLAWTGCDKDPPATDKRTEPWPAPALSSAQASKKPGFLQQFVLAPKQRIEFELKTRKNLITGQFPVVKGSLKVDPMNLKHAEGELSVDLGAVRITAGSDKEQVDRSMTAQNWLNVGASIPEATREHLRWASFVLEEVTEVRTEALHEARLDSKALKRARERAAPAASAALEDAKAPARAEPEPPVPAEIRSTRARLVGSLRLNNRKVTDNHYIELQFHYPVEATPGMPPDRIVVQSLRPMRVPLSQYNIIPRNSAGVALASEMNLIGPEVGKTANVSFSLEFAREEGSAGDP